MAKACIQVERGKSGCFRVALTERTSAGDGKQTIFMDSSPCSGSAVLKKVARLAKLEIWHRKDFGAVVLLLARRCGLEAERDTKWCEKLVSDTLASNY